MRHEFEAVDRILDRTKGLVPGAEASRSLGSYALNVPLEIVRLDAAADRGVPALITLAVPEPVESTVNTRRRILRA